MTKESLVLWLQECDMSSVPIVGGKNASLGEMIQNLEKLGVSVPGGFATTAYAFRYFMKTTGLNQVVAQHLKGLDVSNVEQLRAVGAACRKAIVSKSFPKDLEEDITAYYLEMCQKYRNGADVDCAVRSSATAEDLPNASFAGQQETFLNVHGVEDILLACKRCYASLFTDRAISYRVAMGFDHNQVALSVGVQLMVRSDLAASGVMFSIDTESGFKHSVLINAAYGLGENVVQGAVNPDEYLVFKDTLKEYSPILEKRLGSKEFKMIYEVGGGKPVKNVPVPVSERRKFCITDSQVIQLAKWAVIIEDHYSKRNNRYCPMDMEWALDGNSGKLYIVQARPETVVSQRTAAQNNTLTTYQLRPGNVALKQLCTGSSVGSTIGQGVARVINRLQDMQHFKKGEILVTNRTDPDWEPIMKLASGIVTNQGGRTCHAAIIAREMHIPAVVGCSDATDNIKTGDSITLCCASGERGVVYEGLIPFDKQEVKVDVLPHTRTKVLMNIGNPQDAFRLSTVPCNGVGLARLEFIIANHVKVHPLALIHYDQLKDAEAAKEIAELTKNYESNRPQYFIDHLASGIALIAAAFYPRPVIVRMSDFKSNEYANLLGGKQFEPHEENPMIGWRGASRYYHDSYRQGFALECAAFKKVRDDMGLKNVIPMIPFCRTPKEGLKVIQEMAKNGLVQGKDGLQVYAMCEIPSNVLLADEFLDVFDGFSIGSNDLTQLCLGLDRDSGIVSELFDERSPAVKKLISSVISTANHRGKKIGICGQAPSDFPEFAEFLVSEGITSISLNSDTIVKTIVQIAKLEKELGIVVTPMDAQC